MGALKKLFFVAELLVWPSNDLNTSTNSPMSDLFVLCCGFVCCDVLCCGSGLGNGGSVIEYVVRVSVEFGKLL